MKWLLFWDIDGTLLTTGRAGILSWEEAARRVTARSVDLSRMDTAGLTDWEIAARIVAGFGKEPGPEIVSNLVQLYEKFLPEHLGLRPGYVLPGVREILEYLKKSQNVVSLLLTGNTFAGAKAKLRHYGLGSYFERGAFGEKDLDRPAIARKALALASTLSGGDVSRERAYVIGDTPHDIHCGKAVGARTVAVATGSYRLAQLLEHGPSLAFERLPSPEDFVRVLGISLDSSPSRLGSFLPTLPVGTRRKK